MEVAVTSISEKSTRVLDELVRHGLLLKSDPKLPSVTTLVAGEPVKGSWWGHPRSHEIFGVLEELADQPDVTLVKLISGKDTFVHKRLWNSLFAIGSSQEAWQLAELSSPARALFGTVISSGQIRTDQIQGPEHTSPKVVAEAARDLERRLLVQARQIHTDSGAHAKVLETWKHWASRLALTTPAQALAGRARQDFENILFELNREFNAKGRLPWV
jgi:hypothetical protein